MGLHYKTQGPRGASASLLRRRLRCSTGGWALVIGFKVQGVGLEDFEFRVERVRCRHQERS